MAVSGSKSESLYHEAVKNAFTRIMTDSEFSLSTPRVKLAKDCVGFLQARLNEPDMTSFIDRLGSRLASIVDRFVSDGTGSNSTQREKIWTSFYLFRSTELRALWKELLVKVQVPHVYHSDLWPAQVTARLTLELMIERKYSSLQPASYAPKPLDADEANALRYAAGYVLRSIKQKEDKKKSPNSAVVAWIKQRVSTEIDSTVNGDTYQQFTKQWVEKVNRGGLFLISDSIYELFQSMETVLRQYLPQLSSTKHGINIEEVIDFILKDNEVQLSWTTLAADLSEEDSFKLSRSIVRLWVTIRGFSYASTLVEQYKKTQRCSQKKKKSLRTELKKKSSQ